MSAQKKFHLGTGRRKTSVARVRVAEGKGDIVVNDRPKVYALQREFPALYRAPGTH